MKKLGGGIIILAVLVFSIVGCTEQQRARRYGGNATINLPPDTKLVTATWKGEDLWYLVRPMRPDEKPESHTFIESSSFGIIEGRVFIIEHKKP